MANDFYSVSGSPSTGSSLSSAVVRAEFAAIQSAFDKLPGLSGSGGKLVRVNVGETALEAMALTGGQILYGGAGNAVAQSNNLTWNTTNNTLAITGNVSANGNVAAGAGLISSGASSSSSPSISVLDFIGGTSRLISYGCNAATRGAFSLIVSGSAGSNFLTAISVDQGGNTALNNLNATALGAATLGTTGSVFVRGDTSQFGNVNLNSASKLIVQGPDAAIRLGTSGSIANLEGVDQTGTVAYRKLQISGSSVDIGINGSAVLNIVGSGLATFNNGVVVNALNSNGNISGTNLNITGALRGTSAMMSPVNNSLAADVLLSNVAAYFNGPVLNIGTGTWFVSSTVIVQDTVNNALFSAKLWDGTTVISEAMTRTTTSTPQSSISMSGYITNPSGNVSIAVNDGSGTSGRIMNNILFGGAGKSSTITAIRIG